MRRERGDIDPPGHGTAGLAPARLGWARHGKAGRGKARQGRGTTTTKPEHLKGNPMRHRTPRWLVRLLYTVADALACPTRHPNRRVGRVG